MVDYIRNYRIYMIAIMAFSIKNEEADRLVRELSSRTGGGITDVVLEALREQMKRVTGRRSNLGLTEEIDRMQDRIASLPRLDTRSDDELMAYDPDGLPR